MKNEIVVKKRRGEIKIYIYIIISLESFFYKIVSHFIRFCIISLRFFVKLVMPRAKVIIVFLETN